MCVRKGGGHGGGIRGERGEGKDSSPQRAYTSGSLQFDLKMPLRHKSTGRGGGTKPNGPIKFERAYSGGLFEDRHRVTGRQVTSPGCFRGTRERTAGQIEIKRGQGTKREVRRG